MIIWSSTPVHNVRLDFFRQSMMNVDLESLSEFYEVGDNAANSTFSMKVLDADDAMILCALTGATTDITG